MVEIPNKAKRIHDILMQAGARDVLIVGGFVRDSLLGIASKDVDIEVYGLDVHEVGRVLGQHFNVNAVGVSFHVFNIDNEIDVSLPRRERKTGGGHRGFETLSDPHMSIETAAARRDFTINSMAMRFNGELIDPFNGELDFRGRILRHTSQAFAEDPLRVLRGMQLAGRFSFTLHESTIPLCRLMRDEFHKLPKERIWEEWKKWALRSIKPSKGLQFLVDALWVDFFPEIHHLQGTLQDAAWHPEGDVFTHTGLVCDAALRVAMREQLSDDDRLVLMFAALCHDFGKPSTTEFADGRLRARGHCEAGVGLTEQFLTNIGAPVHLIEHVKPLVAEHLIHANGDPTPRAVRRLAIRLQPTPIDMLGMVIEADHSGRPPLPAGNPARKWVKMAESLEIQHNQPQRILLGRHLIELGMEPGVAMGELLDQAFEAQLDGVFENLDSAKEWARSRV